jgi:hypothetical protein
MFQNNKIQNKSNTIQKLQNKPQKLQELLGTSSGTAEIAVALFSTCRRLQRVGSRAAAGRTLKTGGSSLASSPLPSSPAVRTIVTCNKKQET